MYYPVYEIVHIKDPLLLTVGFLYYYVVFNYMSDVDINITKLLSVTLDKTSFSFSLCVLFSPANSVKNTDYRNNITILTISGISYYVINIRQTLQFTH